MKILIDPTEIKLRIKELNLEISLARKKMEAEIAIFMKEIELLKECCPHTDTYRWGDYGGGSGIACRTCGKDF